MNNVLCKQSQVVKTEKKQGTLPASSSNSQQTPLCLFMRRVFFVSAGHGSSFTVQCHTCSCFAGNTICPTRQCLSSNGDRHHFTGPPVCMCLLTCLHVCQFAVCPCCCHSTRGFSQPSKLVDGVRGTERYRAGEEEVEEKISFSNCRKTAEK